MGFVESALDYSVVKGAEVAEQVVLNSAKTIAVASVLGIGTTAAGLTILAAEHAPEIYAASKYVAGKLVR